MEIMRIFRWLSAGIPVPRSNRQMDPRLAIRAPAVNPVVRFSPTVDLYLSRESLSPVVRIAVSRTQECDIVMTERKTLGLTFDCTHHPVRSKRYDTFTTGDKFVLSMGIQQESYSLTLHKSYQLDTLTRDMKVS